MSKQHKLDHTKPQNLMATSFNYYKFKLRFQMLELESVVCALQINCLERESMHHNHNCSKNSGVYSLLSHNCRHRTTFFKPTFHFQEKKNHRFLPVTLFRYAVSRHYRLAGSFRQFYRHGCFRRFLLRSLLLQLQPL